MKTSIRNRFIDSIKGLAIIGVMTIHMVGFSASDYIMVLIRQVCCVSVSMFFLVAGYFAVETNGIEMLSIQYIKRRLLRLWSPYLVWTLVFVAIFSPCDMLSPGKFLWRDIIMGYGISIGYYVIALSQLVILTPNLVRWAKAYPKASILLSACATWAGMAVSVGAAMKLIPSFGWAVPVPFPMIFFPVWLFPYMLGIVARINVEKIEKYVSGQTRLLAVASLMLLILMCIEFRLWADYQIVAISEHRISAFLFFMVLALLILGGLSSHWHFALLEILGRGSFIIYLTHLKIFQVFNRLERMIGGLFPPAGTIAGYMLRMGVAISFFCVLIYVGERMLPRRIRKCVGIS